MDMNKKYAEHWPIELNHVRARPEGKKLNYVAHYRLNGQHCRRSLNTNRVEVARRAAMAFDQELDAGTYAARPTKIQLGEGISSFLDAKTIDGLAPKSHRKYSTELRTLEAFANEHRIQYVQQIDENFLAKYRQHRAARNLLQPDRSIHAKTAYTATMILVAFLRWSVRRKWIAANPLQDVRIPKPAFQRKYAPPLGVVNAILERTSEPLKTMISLLAFTGMRSGELQLLTIGDVDLDGGWINVHTLKAKLTRIRPIRHVPIHPRLRPILKAHLKNRTGSPTELLFVANASTAYPDGNHQVNTKKLNDQLQNVARRAGFQVGRAVDGIVIHSLRHSFETIAVNSNIPQRVIDTWLGHSGDQSMGSVYYRLDDASSQDFMARVGF